MKKALACVLLVLLLMMSACGGADTASQAGSTEKTEEAAKSTEQDTSAPEAPATEKEAEQENTTEEVPAETEEGDAPILESDGTWVVVREEREVSIEYDGSITNQTKSVYVYEYDDAARLIRESIENEDGSLTVRSEYGYDAAGAKILEVRYNGGILAKRVEYDSQGHVLTEYSDDGLDVRTVTNTYDEHGSLVKNERHVEYATGSQGDYTTTFANTYENDRLVHADYSEVLKTGDNSAENYTGAIDYEYDAAGRLVKKVPTFDNYGASSAYTNTVEYMYNEDGELICERSSVLGAPSGNYESGYLNEYDKNGSLIAETEYNYGETRTIRYENDAEGRPVSSYVEKNGENLGQTTYYEYYKNGLLKRTYRVLDGADAPEWEEICHYDEYGNLVTQEAVRTNGAIETTTIQKEYKLIP